MGTFIPFKANKAVNKVTNLFYLVVKLQLDKNLPHDINSNYLLILRHQKKLFEFLQY